MAEAARRQLDQFERSKLSRAPRLANLVAMFGKFVEMPFFCSRTLRAIVTAVSLTTFDNIDRPKVWNRQLQMVGLTKVSCKRSGNKLPSFYPHRPLFDHSRCFYQDTSADGATDLLEVLRNSPLEKLNFEDCDQIPSTAWQKLRGASWTNLREANFRVRLVLQIWLRCLASSLRRGVFFPMLRANVTAVSLTTFDNIDRPKM